MTQPHPYTYKTRVLRLLLLLLDAPHRYTRKQLATQFGVSADSIKHDINALRDAGLVVFHDDKYRYAISLDQTGKKLKQLTLFSEEERALLLDTIQHVSKESAVGRRLRQKLDVLFTVGQLGKLILRKPYISKVKMIQQGMAQRQCVVLERYKSLNSNRTRDRLVEAFHIDPGADLIQAFDICRKEVRVFRLSRCERVRISDQPWRYETYHQVLATDPFRVADPKQVQVHLTLTTGGYNLLTEQFPLTRAWIQPAAQPEQFDFQCRVNHRFLGLTNFILGNHAHVLAIHEPDALIEHLHDQIQQINFFQKNEGWGS